MRNGYDEGDPNDGIDFTHLSICHEWEFTAVLFGMVRLKSAERGRASRGVVAIVNYALRITEASECFPLF